MKMSSESDVCEIQLPQLSLNVHNFFTFFTVLTLLFLLTEFLNIADYDFLKTALVQAK